MTSQFTLLLSLFLSMLACKQTDTNEMIPEDQKELNEDVPAVFAKVYGAKNISSDGTFITITSAGMPDHESPYYSTDNALYADYSGTTFGGGRFRQNPNSIIEQSFTFKIPLNPIEATNKRATSLGPIGVAINGVPLYNQYAGPNEQPLTNEINSFDQYYGHPQGRGQYHYHVEPIYLTSIKTSKAGLLGFLLDGFPVYGPEEEDGSLVVSDDLDAYHGHSHATTDYPNGTYHYHFTDDAPYLNGNGFYGVAGTVTQ